MSSITAWRISPARYEDTAFGGEGAKTYGGRFNSVGPPLVYTSESLALAILELLAKANARQRLTGRLCLPVTFQEEQVLARTPESLPEGWDKRPYTTVSQDVGDQWVNTERSLVLCVPSVVVPSEHNYLINSLHADFDTLEFGEPIPLRPDPRLFDE